MAPAESELHAAPRGTPWGQVMVFVGAGIVVSFQVGKAPPMLPFIRQELGLDLFLAGWILSVFSVIGLVLGSVLGAISDAFGHRRMLLGGLFAASTGSLLGALSPNAAALLATRVLEGLGFLMVAVSAPALIVRVTRPADMRVALAIWSCWVPAGVAVIMLCTPAITPHFGWRGLWFVNAALLGTYALWARGRTVHLPGPSAATRAGKVGPDRLWRDIRIASTSAGPVLLALIFTTYSVQWLAVMGFLPTILVEEQGLSPGTASVLTGIMVAMNVPGNLAAGRLLQRGLRRWRLIAVAGAVMGLCSVAIFSPAVSFPLRYLSCLLFSGVGGLLPASVLSGVPTHAPRTALVATTYGLIVQGSQFGQVMGPPALALTVAHLGGWQSAPWLLTGTAALGILLSLVLAARERTKPRGTEL